MASIDRLRTKIVATIGPASESPTMIERLIRAGVDVFRLNFSHGSHEEHGTRIAAIKRLRDKLGRPVAIVADLSGPKMRLGYLHSSPMELKRGGEVALIPADQSQAAGDIPFPDRAMLRRVEPGHSILLQDGNLQIEAIANEGGGRRVRCRVKNGGLLYSEQGIYFPVSAASIPAITDKDRADVRFGVGQGVDYFAVSFVKDEKDIRLAREAVREAGGRQPLIAKIEKPEALRALEKIIEAADAVMVARGDLGVEIPLERVPHEQKRIIRLCNERARPVITATQMLESMTERPRPTRAEVTDVANSILDGTDAVMLSGETAVGKFALKAVQTMAKIIATTEKNFEYGRRLFEGIERRGVPAQRAIARAACVLAHELDLHAIVCCTQSGSTARIVSAYRPRAPICALTLTTEAYHQLALQWGVTPLLAREPESAGGRPAHSEDMEWMVAQAVESIQKSGVIRRCEDVVVVAGVPLLTPGTTNFLRVINSCALPSGKE